MKTKTQWMWRNRYGQNRITTKTGDRSFTIEGTSAFVRCGASETDPDSIGFVDFEGGPFVSVGESMWEYGVAGKEENLIVSSVSMASTPAEDLPAPDWVRVEVTTA